MSELDGALDEHLLSAFCERFLADAADSGPKPLAHYLRQFAGHEELIAREFFALSREIAEDATPASAGDEVRLGPYVLIEELGRGGQATVWLAHDSRLDRRVALKVLRGSGEGIDSELRRFRREASITAALDDPGICPVFEIGHDEVSWIAMRYVEGQTLAAVIERGCEPGRSAGEAPGGKRAASSPTRSSGSGKDDRETKASRMPLEEVLQLAEAIARSLHVAHEAGVVHRDVKPANIMLTPANRPVILDFGIARADASESSALTASDQRVGTPIYMAPEQVRGDPVDRRTDVYALGLTLHELLTGERAFARPTVDSTYHAILGTEVPRLRTHGIDAPRDLDVILETATAKERDRRYATAKDLADDLARLMRSEPIHARRIGWLPRALLWARRHPPAAALILGIPILTASLAYIAATRGAVLAREAEVRLLAIEDSLAAGLRELHHGNPAEGKDLVRSTAEDAPDSLDAQVVYDWVLIESDRSAEALERAASRGESEVSRVIERLARSGGEEVVDADGENTAEGEARSALSRFVLGSAAIRRGHVTRDRQAFEQAVTHFRAAVLTTERPRLVLVAEYAHALGHVAELEGSIDAAEALAVAARLRTRWPESFIANYQAGLVLATVDVESASEAYSTAERLASPHQWREVRGNHARLLLSARRLDRAMEILAELIPLSQNRAEQAGLLDVRGRVHAHSGDEEAAITDLRSALEIAPALDETRFMLAQVLEEIGRDEEALREFAELARRAPTARSIGMWARALERVGRLDEAVREARKSLELPFVGEPGERETRGHCLLLLDRAEVAAGKVDGDPELRERALAFLPDLPELWHQRTIDLIVRRDMEQARAAARRAVALDSERPEYRFLHGLTLLGTSEEDQGFELMGDAYASGRLGERLTTFGSERAAEAVFFQVRDMMREPRRPDAVVSLVERGVRRFRSPDFVVKAAMFFIDLQVLGKRAEGVELILPVVPEISPKYVGVLGNAAEKLWNGGERAAGVKLMKAVLERARADGVRSQLVTGWQARYAEWLAAMKE